MALWSQSLPLTMAQVPQGMLSAPRCRAVYLGHSYAQGREHHPELGLGSGCLGTGTASMPLRDPSQ